MFDSQARIQPTIQQLPLPLFNPKPPPTLPLSELDPLLPDHVWNSLSPAKQTQARCEILRIVREVLDEATVR
jgi:hypothetical protein